MCQLILTKSDRCRERGLMNGVSSDKFNPDAPVTRAQLAVVLDRIYEQEDK